MAKQAKDLITHVTVKDLSDYQIVRAVLDKAGADLYQDAIKEYGAAKTNLNMYRSEMELKFPGITLAEVEDMLSKATPEDVTEVVGRAISRTYNDIQIVSVSGTNGQSVFMAVLGNDDSVTDGVKNILDTVEQIQKGSGIAKNEETGEENSMLDLPVCVWKYEGDKIIPKMISANITKLAEEIREKQA